MITVFTTGGTFDKIYFDAKSEFSIGDPQIVPLLKEANVDIDYYVESLIKKDSLDITEDDRQIIVQAVSECNSQKILITHGTDTMVETATAIATNALVKEKNKTIVLLGAMQPAKMRYSDAPFNLGFGIASVQLLQPGVYIAMNGQVFPYDKVEKNRAAAKFQST